jgi:hypothetical protein
LDERALQIFDIHPALTSTRFREKSGNRIAEVSRWHVANIRYGLAQ